jgi:hypothetical protein
MNKIHFLFSLLILIINLQGCIVPQFAEPQPVGVKNKNNFPSAFWGRYNVSLLNIESQPDDQSTIIIDSTHLNLYEVKKMKITLSDVKADSTIKLLDGYIYVEGDGRPKVSLYQLLNDTIYYTDSNKVELDLSQNCILREWKGRFFLNHQRDKNWDVLMMDPQNNNSYIIKALILTENSMDSEGLFLDPNEIPIDSFYYKKAPAPQAQPKPKKEKMGKLTLEDLDKITSYKKDKEDYIIRPSRRQLKKLINKNFFKDVWRIEGVKRE